jgi:hypothetical protein
MTLKTGFRIAPRIDDGIARAAALVMNAARSMAGFASHFLGVRAFSHQTRVVGRMEILRDILMALFAGFAANKGGAFDVRRDYDGSLHGRTGDHRYSGGEPEQTEQYGHW